MELHISKSGRYHDRNCLSLTHDGPCLCIDQVYCAKCSDIHKPISQDECKPVDWFDLLSKEYVGDLDHFESPNQEWIWSYDRPR